MQLNPPTPSWPSAPRCPGPAPADSGNWYSLTEPFDDLDLTQPWTWNRPVLSVGCATLVRMDAKDVAQHCEALKGSTREFPFGPQPTVYKVGGKIFAILAEDERPPRVSLKLPPDEVQALQVQYEGTVLPGYHLNKRHWVTVLLDGILDEDELTALLDESYDVVVETLPKTRRPA
jgi:predicted DNA-binding protein (MmcQ/YjbR family)